MNKKEEITQKPTVMVVINDLKPEDLQNLGASLKTINAHVTLLKRVPLSENGPMGATQARLDLSTANHHLNISAAQQIVHGLNHSVLTGLINKRPVDAMVIGKANSPPVLFVKNTDATGMQALMTQMPHKILAPHKLSTEKSLGSIPYQSLFATIKSKPPLQANCVAKTVESPKSGTPLNS